MPIIRETHDSTVVLRMSRPPVNALDLDLLADLISTLDELATDAPPLVLTGDGTTFSAGVDLRRITEGTAGYVTDFLTALVAAFRAVFHYPAPTVAAVNGHAIAGGYVLAAACDHRVAADTPARLGLSELRVGVPLPTEAIEIVRHAVGTPAATELVLGADLMDVTTAHANGFIHDTVPPETLMQTAVRQAALRAGRGPESYLLAKRQLQRPAWENIERSGRTEDAVVKQLWSRVDTLDRIRQFMATIT